MKDAARRAWERAYRKRKREADPEKWRADRRRYYRNALKRDPEYFRRANHKKYGHPAPTRPRPRLCECCGKPPIKRVLALDHCRKTRKFRGWLCTLCNTAIGSLGDNLQGLQRAIRYLRKCM